MSAAEYDRYDWIRGVLAAGRQAADGAGDPRTRRKCEDRQPARIATVLGRWAERGEVEVITDRPYRYRLEA